MGTVKAMAEGGFLRWCDIYIYIEPKEEPQDSWRGAERRDRIKGEERSSCDTCRVVNCIENRLFPTYFLQMNFRGME